MTFLSANHKLLEDDVLTLTEYPLKKVALALTMLLASVACGVLDYSLLPDMRKFTLVVFFVFIPAAISLAFISTVDTLQAQKSTSVISFSRMGLTKKEHRSFKFNQVKDLRLVQTVTKNSSGILKTFKIQASLISGVSVDLFRSFSKQTVRQNVSRPWLTSVPASFDLRRQKT